MDQGELAIFEAKVKRASPAERRRECNHPTRLAPRGETPRGYSVWSKRDLGFGNTFVISWLRSDAFPVSYSLTTYFPGQTQFEVRKTY
jgi:hypothetical protein